MDPRLILCVSIGEYKKIKRRVVVRNSFSKVVTGIKNNRIHHM